MKMIRRFAAICLMLVICTVLTVSAFAAPQTAAQYHTDPTGFGAITEMKEKHSSLYVDGDSSVWASAWLRDKAGNPLPAGTLGIEARLYNDSGELCADTGMRYNTQPASFVNAVTTASSEGYCSCGHIRTLYFNDYESFTVENDQRLTVGGDFSYRLEENTYDFPEKLLAMAREHEDGYPENSAGETYGSALLLGYNRSYTMPPVLLSAVGSGGVHGYVREADLNPCLDTRENAVDYMSKLEENRALPLYDQEGNVIGTFVLDGSFTSGTTADELERARAAEAAEPGKETRQAVELPKSKAEFDALVKRLEANCPYRRNSKGETYSSAGGFGGTGYFPVWVTAVSSDGDPGVVRAKDYYRAESGTILPVYDLEGNEIGEIFIE